LPYYDISLLLQARDNKVPELIEQVKGTGSLYVLGAEEINKMLFIFLVVNEFIQFDISRIHDDLDGPVGTALVKTGLLFEIKTLKSALDSMGPVGLTKSAPVINLADSETQNLYSNRCFIAQKYGTVFYG
jgi:hypothetical protein